MVNRAVNVFDVMLKAFEAPYIGRIDTVADVPHVKQRHVHVPKESGWSPVAIQRQELSLMFQDSEVSEMGGGGDFEGVGF